MKTIVLSTMGLLVIGFLFLGIGSSYSQEFPQGTPMIFGQPNISGWDSLEASRMVTGQLTTQSGDYLGRISDLVIDENGSISEVVLSDIQGKGGEQISIPYAAVSHARDNIFVFDKDLEYRWRFSDVGGAYFEEPYSQWAEIQFIYSVPPGPEGPYRFSTLMGASVRTSKGDEAGWVNDLVIDLTKNQTVYVVLSDLGGGEQKMVAVPFKELSKGDGNVYVVHVTKEKLLDSPAFAWSDVSNRKYAENVYTYYGLQPRWGEEN